MLLLGKIISQGTEITSEKISTSKIRTDNEMAGSSGVFFWLMQEADSRTGNGPKSYFLMTI